MHKVALVSVEQQLPRGRSVPFFDAPQQQSTDVPQLTSEENAELDIGDE